MKDIIFKGCGTAIATPFANDEIDYLEFKKLLKFVYPSIIMMIFTIVSL